MKEVIEIIDENENTNESVEVISFSPKDQLLFLKTQMKDFKYLSIDDKIKFANDYVLPFGDLQLLFDIFPRSKFKPIDFYSKLNLKIALQTGNLDLVNFIYSHVSKHIIDHAWWCIFNEFLYPCIKNGHFHVLKWLEKKTPIFKHPFSFSIYKCLLTAACYDKFDIFMFFNNHTTQNELFTIINIATSAKLKYISNLNFQLQRVEHWNDIFANFYLFDRRPENFYYLYEKCHMKEECKKSFAFKYCYNDFVKIENHVENIEKILELALFLKKEGFFI